MLIVCRNCHEMVQRRTTGDPDYPDIDWVTYTHIHPGICGDYVLQEEAH